MGLCGWMGSGMTSFWRGKRNYHAALFSLCVCSCSLLTAQFKPVSPRSAVRRAEAKPTRAVGGRPAVFDKSESRSAARFSQRPTRLNHHEPEQRRFSRNGQWRRAADWRI